MLDEYSAEQTGIDRNQPHQQYPQHDEYESVPSLAQLMADDGGKLRLNEGELLV